MSQETVDVVQAGFEAWNAGDMDAFGELLAADVILRLPDGWPEPGPYLGREATMRQFEQNRAVFDADTLEPIGDFIGVGDRVLVRMIWRGLGQGPESALEWTNMCTVRKGKVMTIEYFWDHAEALEALGLSEQDAHTDS
jgi:ketosteroid isomerase-like protein